MDGLLSDYLGPVGIWHWWILGGVLLILELLAPGIFFMWLAAAAALTGIAAAALPMAWPWQVLVFTVLGVGFAFSGRALFPPREENGHPTLNRRAERQIGETYAVAEPIVNGRGKVKVGDSLWSVRGPDTPVGRLVTVVGVDGSVLVVEKARD